MKRPTFEELLAEASAFIGPPRPPKLGRRDDGRDLSDDELAAMPDLAGRFRHRDGPTSTE